jgi:hypothetical protein
MKMHIEVELEWCEPDEEIVGRYDANGNYHYIKAKDLNKHIGQEISFDEAYMKKGPWDDSQGYRAKLINVIPNQKGDYKRPTGTPGTSIDVFELAKRMKDEYDKIKDTIK